LHGEGIFKWRDGTSYEGDFKYNKIEGQGTFNWIDGSTYTG